MITLEKAKALLGSATLTRGDAFQILKTCSSMIMQQGISDDAVLDCVIRLVEKASELHELDQKFSQMISALCREVGLFPYLNLKSASWDDALACEMFRDPTNPQIIFHQEQARIFNELAAGRGIALSAPTSFGKSILIDATIRARKPNTVVIIVPTISLLDETRRRIKKTFGEGYRVITLNSQARLRTDERVIFIGTQERLFERTDIADIDFLVIDEFYKLNLGKQDQSRAITLNLLLTRLARRSKQIYLLGPPVEDVKISGPLAERLNVRTSTFAPVTSEIYDLTSEPDSFKALVRVLQEHSDDATMIFSGSPPRAQSLVASLVTTLDPIDDKNVQRLADWMGENYHPNWYAVEGVRRGIGVHHGRVPRSISQMFVRLFNRKIIKTLVCTSSLIEGVNTSAKNVCVYDKTIDGTKSLNNFEYQNIKGRAGRMFQHYIGRIFLFNNPPEVKQFAPEIPAFQNPELSPDEILLQLPPEYQNDTVLYRRGEMLRDRLLSTSILERWSRYGVENLEALARAAFERMETHDRWLLWRGYGKRDQILETFEFLWKNFIFEKHNLTAKQVTHFAVTFRRLKSIRKTLDYLIERSDGRYSDSQTIEGFFCFLRGSDFTFPTVLQLLQDVITDVEGASASELIDYAYFARELQNWFIPGALRGLDEYGVPLPIIQKYQAGLSKDNVDVAADQLRRMVVTGRIKGIEAKILSGALEISRSNRTRSV